MSLPISSVSASGNDGNLPENAVDGDLATRWSCDGIGCKIVLDLGSLKQIQGVQLAWYNGDLRQSGFVIETSSDGASYVSAYSGQSQRDHRRF